MYMNMHDRVWVCKGKQIRMVLGKDEREPLCFQRVHSSAGGSHENLQFVPTSAITPLERSTAFYGCAESGDRYSYAGQGDQEFVVS